MKAKQKKVEINVHDFLGELLWDEATQKGQARNREEMTSARGRICPQTRFPTMPEHEVADGGITWKVYEHFVLKVGPRGSNAIYARKEP